MISRALSIERGGEGGRRVGIEVALHELPDPDDVALGDPDRCGNLSEAAFAEVRQVVADDLLGARRNLHLALLAQVLDLCQQRLGDGA